MARIMIMEMIHRYEGEMTNTDAECKRSAH
jgi:hypothetical protein